MITRSILAHASRTVDTPTAITIGLHAFDADHAQGLALASALGDSVAAHAPVSPRPVSPRFAEGSKSLDGRLWFFEREGYVEPSLFGDSLRQLEAFLCDTIDRHDDADRVPLVLVGRGQGGVLALVLAMAWPELVDVTVTIDATLPAVPGWTLPESDLGGRVVHLLTTRPESDGDRATETTLRRAGADVRLRSVEEANLTDELARIGTDLLA